MPVITFASPKGGAGKTTAALLLATELTVKGFHVTVIDADPLKWIKSWSKLSDKPGNLEVLARSDRRHYYRSYRSSPKPVSVRYHRP